MWDSISLQVPVLPVALPALHVYLPVTVQAAMWAISLIVLLPQISVLLVSQLTHSVLLALQLHAYPAIKAST